MFIYTSFLFIAFLLLNFNLPLWLLGNQDLLLENPNPKADQFEISRQQMVEYQIKARGITDQRVLNAMSTVPRHEFVESSLVSMAYEDTPLPIGHNQTISQPYIVAYMSDIAEISPEDKVLEIGTGCGYQSAILGKLAKEVYTMEVIPVLAEKAQKTLKNLNYTNIHVKTEDGYEGWAENQPYDRILVTAAPDHIPQPLIDQLALNGKMVIPVGKEFQVIVILTKKPEGLVTEKTIPVRFVPLIRG